MFLENIAIDALKKSQKNEIMVLPVVKCPQKLLHD
jgi:hypothetical protein